MQIDIKTSSVQPIRNTYAYTARRFGDKPASRYQEASFDIQEEINFHYKPLWEPERELYDKARSSIEMVDWYVLKDPRQFYYGTYTMARARQGEVFESNFSLAERTGFVSRVSTALLDFVRDVLVPLRHYEWAANMNNDYVTAYGYGAALTNATMFATMDRLGTAQYLTRIGLMFDPQQGPLLDAAKDAWLQGVQWQPLRAAIEQSFVCRDFFELFVAQNLVFDGYIYPFVKRCVERWADERGGMELALLTAFMNDWFDETKGWVDSVIKTVVAESEANRNRVEQWTSERRAVIQSAIAALATHLGSQVPEGLLAELDASFDARIRKLGLAGNGGDA